jgi:hypothetical protein
MTVHHLLLLLVSCIRSELADADDDQLLLVDEEALGTDPDNADSDGDGLKDGHEVYFHLTDPTLADSDGDGDEDGWEIDRGLDPLDPESRRYEGGWPMLTISAKSELREDLAPPELELGKRLKETLLFDQYEDNIDIYDISLQSKYIFISVSSGSWVLTQWMALDTEVPPEGVPADFPPELLQMLEDGTLAAAFVAIETSPGAFDDKSATTAKSLEKSYLMPHTIDYASELWAFLGQPDPMVGMHLLLDDHMIVRAIDDFDLMLDLIEAGHLPPAED